MYVNLSSVCKVTILFLALLLSNGCSEDSNSSSLREQQSTDEPLVETTSYPPTAFAGVDITANPGQAVTLSGSGYDVDGYISHYQWHQRSGTPVSLQNASQVMVELSIPIKADSEQWVFDLTVTDNSGAQATDSVTVTVPATPAIPVEILGPLAVESGQTVQWRARLQGGEEGVQQYQWRQTAGTPVTLSDSNTATPSITVPTVANDESVTLTLVVTSPNGKTQEINQSLAINTYYRHHIMLSVVRVTQDWMSYASIGGWPQAMQKKESPHLKYYEATLWEETRSVHLYAFPNSFDPVFGLDGQTTPEQRIAYREQFAVRRYDGLPPENQSKERSAFLRDAFIDMAKYLAVTYPNSDHHLMYRGHGSPGGMLFENQLNYEDSALFLEQWNIALGHKLGVVDMGGPCNKGSYSDLKNFCQFADYYIASDLQSGGFTFDEWTPEKSDSVDLDYWFHEHLAKSVTLGEALKRRLQNVRNAYEFSINNMTRQKIMRAKYLYSCADANRFGSGFENFVRQSTRPWNGLDDVLQWLQEGGADAILINQYRAMILYSVDNKDFFPWPEQRNGLLMYKPPGF